MARALDRQHHLEPLTPLLEEQGNDFGRILEISRQDDDRVRAGLQQRMDRRTDVPEVPGVDDDLDVPIARRDIAKDLDRLVRGRVVDEEMLIVLVERLE